LSRESNFYFTGTPRKRIAQEVFRILEQKYYPAEGWELNTILQEKAIVICMRKIGYKKNGKAEFYQ
jgi:hypothetical protein